MAFQITDDVLDYTESESVTGKPSGLDLREHKITLPLIMALPQMDPAERKIVANLMADVSPSDDAIAAVIDIVESREGVEGARARAAEFAGQGAEELEALPPGQAREALADCITYAIERRS
jgi:octaprenyl-diphosphate synthase